MVRIISIKSLASLPITTMLQQLLSAQLGTGEPVLRFEYDQFLSFHFIKFIGVCLLLVLSNIISPGILERTIKSLFNPDLLREEFERGEKNKVISIFILLIIAWGSFSSVLSANGFNSAYGNSFIINLLLVVVLSLILFMLNVSLHYIFFGHFQVINVHSVDYIGFVLNAGVFSIGLLVAYWFAGVETQMTATTFFIVFLAIVFLFRIVKLGIDLGRIYHENGNIIFFYLCAVEIGPYLIVVKLLHNLK